MDDNGSDQGNTARPDRAVALSIAAAAAAGMVLPIQARLNGELGHRLGDSTAAAGLSFASGLVIMTVLAVFSSRLRRALRMLGAATRDGRLRSRYLFAGVFGGTFALAQSTTALLTGIAVFTVAVIAGQTLGGLVVDAGGIGGGIKRRPGGHRLIGTAVILAAAAVSAWPGFADTPTPLTVLLPALGALAAGVLLGLQQAMNGATSAAAGSPLAATWVNFCAGSVFLGIAWCARQLFQGQVITGPTPPTEWWLYLGGLCGVVFIGASALLVRRIGVLLLAMASIAGQLASSVAVDLVAPSGSQPPSVFTVLAAVLTFAAVWIASRHPHGSASGGTGAQRRQPRT